MKYLISACLVGENCKYDGGNNFHIKAKELLDKGEAITVCPEMLGGLPAPRVSCEIRDGKVINKIGLDVTDEFNLGAHISLEIANKNGIKYAIMQPRSPSCGSNKIYDGSFSGKLIDGEGVTTKLLRQYGIEVMSIEEFLNNIDL